MSTFDPYRPAWTPGRRTTVRDSELRVSDSERRDVADALSEQYGEGRLDQVEFEERLNKAMSAKTRGDLAGLLADFPRSEGSPAPAARPPRRGLGFLPLALLAFAFLLATSAASAFVHPHVPWFLFALLAIVLWRRGHYHHHHHHDEFGRG